MRLIALMAAGIVCAACTTPESVENAGLSDWRLEFTDDGKPKSIHIRDGKERSDVTFKVNLQTGNAEYSAAESLAFDGQAFAAEVAKVQANEQGQTIREVLTPEALRELVALARLFILRQEETQD